MKVGSRRSSFFGAAMVMRCHRKWMNISSSELPMHFNVLRPLLAVDQRRQHLGLFAVAAGNGELVLALLAVPDGVLASQSHGHPHLADVLRDRVTGHAQSCPSVFAPSI